MKEKNRPHSQTGILKGVFCWEFFSFCIDLVCFFGCFHCSHRHFLDQTTKTTPHDKYDTMATPASGGPPQPEFKLLSCILFAWCVENKFFVCVCVCFLCVDGVGFCRDDKKPTTLAGCFWFWGRRLPSLLFLGSRSFFLLLLLFPFFFSCVEQCIT